MPLHSTNPVKSQYLVEICWYVFYAYLGLCRLERLNTRWGARTILAVGNIGIIAKLLQNVNFNLG